MGLYLWRQDAAAPAAGGSTDAGAESSGTSGSSLAGALLTADGTSHTKGAWTELIAAADFDADMVEVTFRGVSVSATDTSMTIDIGVGAAASETVLIPDILNGHLSAGPPAPMVRFRFPVSVAAGSRISGRMQGAVSGDVCRVSVRLLAAGSHTASGSSVVAYGVNAAASNGVTLTAPASNDTKGDWTEITSATSADHTWLVVGVSGQGAALVTANGMIDIGTGSAGNEVVVIPDLIFAMTTGDDILWEGSPEYTVNIPSGTRIVARYQSSNNGNGGRPAVAVYGV